MTLDQEIAQHLDRLGVVPLPGGLIPETACATLIGYAPSYLRRLAAAHAGPLRFVRRGNRRLYRLDDVRAFLTSTVE